VLSEVARAYRGFAGKHNKIKINDTHNTRQWKQLVSVANIYKVPFASLHGAAMF